MVAHLNIIVTVTREAYHLVEVEMSDYMDQEENQAGQIQAWFSGTVILQAQPACLSRPTSCGTGLQTMVVWGFLASCLRLCRNGVPRRPVVRLPADNHVLLRSSSPCCHFLFFTDPLKTPTSELNLQCFRTKR